MESKLKFCNDEEARIWEQAVLSFIIELKANWEDALPAADRFVLEYRARVKDLER